MESGIQLKEFRNPTNDWNLESNTWNSESKNVLDSLTWWRSLVSCKNNHGHHSLVMKVKFLMKKKIMNWYFLQASPREFPVYFTNFHHIPTKRKHVIVVNHLLLTCTLVKTH